MPTDTEAAQTAPALQIPISEVGRVQNPPIPDGAAAPPASDPVADLIKAARPETFSPGPAISDGKTPSDTTAGSKPEGEAAEKPAQQEKAVSFADLAEEERRIRQRDRALTVRQAQLQQREQELQRTGQVPSREDRMRALREDPVSYFQKEYGLGLDQLADVVTGSAKDRPADASPAVQELRTQLAETQQRLAAFEQAQNQAITTAQWHGAVSGIARGLDQAKESYPLLVGMLGVEKAAEAIVQGVTQSYTQEGFKTADEVAAELEANLQPIADRLIAAKPKPTAATETSPPRAPSQRLTNETTSTVRTPQGKRTRAEEVERAAEALRFVGE